MFGTLSGQELSGELVHKMQRYATISGCFVTGYQYLLQDKSGDSSGLIYFYPNR